MSEKICKKCNVMKNHHEYGKNKNNKDGLSFSCKECEKIRHRQYRLENPEKIRLSQKKYIENNPEKFKLSQKKYIENNPEKSSKNRMKKYRECNVFKENEKLKRRDYYLKNLEKERVNRKKYYEKNKDRERKYNNEWKRKKMKNDPLFRIKINLRNRINKMLKGHNVGLRTFEIIGLNSIDFKKYIEDKFKKGMTWENYGLWHIDHIKPLNLCKDKNDVISFNHYTNLQPLWAEENIKKNRKYDN